MPDFVNLMTISKETDSLYAIVYKQKYTLFYIFILGVLMLQVVF